VIFYILGILYVYIIIFFFKKLPLPLLFFSTIPLILFSSLRGSSGKDTYAYLVRFDNFDINEANLFYEPILNFMIYFTKSFSNSHELFFFLHASVVCLLFSLALKKYDELKLYFLSLGPMFLIDGITNGMRITLAYHLILVGVAYKKLFMTGVLAFASHISALVGLFSIYLFRIMELKSPMRFLLMALLASLGLYLLTNFEQIFEGTIAISKLEYYSNNTLNTWYSGIADITVLFFILFTAALSNPSWFRILSFFIMALAASLLFFYAIQTSLGAIRVLKVFNIALLVSKFSRSNRSRVQTQLFFILGLAYSINFIRQVIYTPGTLPYPGLVN